MVHTIVDVSEARDDWHEALQRLELVRAIQQRAGAEAVARTWTGDTTP